MNRDITENLGPRTSQFDKEKNYWLKKFSGELVKSYFPYDFRGKDMSDFNLDTMEFTISGDLFSKLIHLTNRSDKNLFVVLAAALAILLSKCTRNSDIVIGCPILKQEVEGEFLNTILALRNLLIPTMTFRELLVQVKQTFNEANENSNYSIQRLLYYLGLPKIENGFPLFETVILFQNIHDRKYIEKMNHNLVFRFHRTDLCIEGILEYNSMLYRKRTIERITSYLLNFLENILKDLNFPLSDIEILPKEEQHQILVAFNDTRTSYPEDKVFHKLFEEQVKRTPNNLALISEDAHFSGKSALTYTQLNKKSTQLARFLRQKGIREDTILGILTAPSLEMAIGIIAVSKAGGAYLPIDHEAPRDRIEYLLTESNCSILLTQSFLKVNVNFNGEKINIDDERLYIDENYDLEKISSPKDLFYTIYTSGTTGRPKGGLLTNRNLVNYVTWFSKTAHLTDKDKTIMASSFAFDLGYTTFLGSLLTGGELHLISKETYINAETLLDYIREKHISYLKMTPSLFSVVVSSPGFSMETCRTLRLIVLGGEEINTLDVERAHHICSHIKIMNHYGPTETTIGSVAQFIDFICFEEYKTNPTIGNPIHNTKAYILDQHLKLVPIGISGELFIGGDGVARGYLNQQELTAEKFIENPYPSPLNLNPSPKLYRTGDLARWHSPGVIEFLGRIDNQVKIRGYRIELGEIEIQLMSHEAVKEAVVVTRENSSGALYLCAYIVSAFSENQWTASGLREYLSSELPIFMIPSYFVQLEEMPLTPNGKLDRSKLPEPEANVNSVAEYEGPRDEVEQKLIDVWHEVLGVENVGINDNFFTLGGDSIKMIQISSRLMKHKLKIEISDLFQHQTIKQLTGYVNKMERVIDQGIVEGEVLLSTIQCWFFEKHFIDNHHYNQSLMLYKEEGFNEESVEKVLSKIVKHHDALRMVFKRQEDGGKGSIMQINRGVEGKLFEFEIIRIEDNEDTAAKIEREANRIQRGINLETGPLMRLGLFKTDTGDHLLMVIHHLVVDGVSWRILLEDFGIGYSQVQSGQEIKFQDKSDSFKYWTTRLMEYAESEELLKELEYWRKIEETGIETLPIDFEIPEEERKVKNMERVSMYLNEEYTRKLLREVNWAYNTEINDILLTALAMGIQEWAGVTRVFIELEGHGRERLMEDVEINRTVGWFTCKFPVLLDINRDDPLPNKIKFVKEKLRRIPHKGAGYNILKYLTSEDKKRKVKLQIEPEITFNYLGEFGQEISGDGIFKMSTFRMGDTISLEINSGYILDVLGILVEGKLMLAFYYNKYEYKMHRIEALMEGVNANLIKIIDCCTQKEEKELTPSDFGDEELSIEELDDIKEILQL